MSASLSHIPWHVEAAKCNVVASQAEVTSGVRVRQAMDGEIIRWDDFGDA